MKYVQAGSVAAIAAALKTAVDNYHIGIITAGDFLSNSEGAALPGDPYANMRSILDIARTEGGVGAAQLSVANTAHTVMEGYTSGELIRQYTNSVEWSAYGGGATAAVTINENTTAATTVRATDADTGQTPALRARRRRGRGLLCDQRHDRRAHFPPGPGFRDAARCGRQQRL
jgi:hypothetical protein